MSNKPIYICVTPFFPTPSAWQGAYVLDQVKAIQRNSEYEVVVFRTLPLGSKPYTYEVDGVTVHAIAPLLMPSYILNGATEGIVGHMFVRTLKKLGIDPMRVAYVHCHTTSHSAFGFGVKRVNPNAKVLVQFHDLDPLTLRNGKWADKRWNRRYRARKSISALNRADLLICISEPVKDVLLSFPEPRKADTYKSALRMYKDVKGMPAVKPKAVYILNNGVDTRIFKPNENPNPNVNSDSNANFFAADANENYRKLSANYRKCSLGTDEILIHENLRDIHGHLRLKEEIFRIGCIANFQELKDHITLVKAFGILVKKGYTNMRLSLLGSGGTRSDIEAYLKHNNLMQYVEWPSEVSHDKLPEYYRSLDLFVLPSIFEGFGCVYTEAYACGVPFMGVYDQGAAEVISPEERDKWLIQPRDYEQLARIIECYYNDRNKQILCKEYDIDKLINDYLRYIESKGIK